MWRSPVAQRSGGPEVASSNLVIPTNKPPILLGGLLFKSMIILSKTAQYELLLEQVKALVAGEPNRVANMANAVAAIHQTMGFWWTGYYLVQGSGLSKVL